MDLFSLLVTVILLEGVTASLQTRRTCVVQGRAVMHRNIEMTEK